MIGMCFLSVIYLSNNKAVTQIMAFFMVVKKSNKTIKLTNKVRVMHIIS